MENGLRALVVLMLVFAFVSSSNASLTILPKNDQAASFFDGKVVTLEYSGGYTCLPALSQVYYNISAVANVTDCGIVLVANVSGTFPVWVTVPAFAGFSVYGLRGYNASADGFATYNGNVVLTDCGSGVSRAACPGTPKYFFNPAISYAEEYYGVYNGIGGLPEGLMPLAAHDNVVFNNYTGTAIPWYAVWVRVFDPNIFPNASTGRCTQVAPSNLTSPTGNCLTSLDAIRRALNTKNSYVPAINKNNPLWIYDSNSSYQAVIPLSPNVTGIEKLLYHNTNLYLTFRLNQTNYYSHAIMASEDNSVITVGVFVLIILISAAWWFAFGSKRYSA